MAKEKRIRTRLDFWLGNTVNEIFMKIPPSEARELFSRVKEESARRGLFYETEDGRKEVIPLLVRPRIITLEQRSYFHKVCHEITCALAKLPALYLDHPEVRRLLPFTPDEERWLRNILKQVGKAPQAIFSRLDANADFASLEWDEKVHFFENNAVGAGGVHYVATAEQIIKDTVIPAMQRVVPRFIVKENDDPRLLLLEELTRHARSIGKRRLNIAFIQDCRTPGGPSEFPQLVEYFRGRGVNCLLADPRDFILRGDEVFCADIPVDLMYRDTTLLELLLMERSGEDVSAMRYALGRNMVVSSISGEFDHKSTWEILTNESFQSHFTKRQWSIFKRHILWTRVIRETKTTGPAGEKIDLVPYIRKNKDLLVLKPNRECGGEGIVIGQHADLGAWDEAIQKVFADASESWVVQQYIDVYIKDFPVLSEDGGICLEDFYSIIGFYATRNGLGILGRSSKRRVVNVAQEGVMNAVLVLV